MERAVRKKVTRNKQERKRLEKKNIKKRKEISGDNEKITGKGRVSKRQGMGEEGESRETEVTREREVKGKRKKK